MKDMPHVTIGMCSAEVIEASDFCGLKLLTMRLVYPRFIHAELMTHRVFSRNASSSRAIPADKQIDFVTKSPVHPDIYTKTNTGMESPEAWEDKECVAELNGLWRAAAFEAAYISKQITDKNVSKQVTNRLLEPFLPITTIVTSSKWSNFFHLRLQKDADPQMQLLAYCIYKAYNSTAFGYCDSDSFHAPFVSAEDYAAIIDKELYKKYDLTLQQAIMYVSAARCARISYLPRKSTSIHDDVLLAKKLISSCHLSPFEHFAISSVVKSLSVSRNISNLNPIEDIIDALLNGEDEIHMWVQGRKLLERFIDSKKDVRPNLSPYVKQFLLNEATKGSAHAKA